MKIIHLLPKLGYGGTESVVLTLGQSQTYAGHESIIVVFTEENPRDLNKNQGLTKCRNMPVNLGIIKSHKRNTEYEAIIDEFQPDVIHSHSLWTHIIALSGKRKDIRYVFQFHRFPNEVQQKPFSRRFRDKLSISLGIIKYFNSSVVFVSKALRNHFLKNWYLFWLVRANIFVIGNPIQHDFFAKTKSIARTKTPYFRLLTVSRLEKEKNINLLPLIAKELVDRGLPYVWDIYGDGSEKELLKEEIKKTGQEGKIVLKGTRTNLAQILKKYDALISVSTKESFGLILLEAFASGVPVIALRNLGANDFVENGKNAFYLKSSKIGEICNSILLLRSNRDIKEALVFHAKQTAKLYSPEKISRIFLNLYRW
jgi:glycosyltransferase involved in cell wall biosynthesis